MNYYLDGFRYDIDYQERTEDIDFYLKECLSIKGNILELGCGTGRVSIPLKQRGASITCIDNSLSMLEQAKIKSKALDLDIKYIEQDFTKLFNLNKSFECIIAPFNTLQHAYSVDDISIFLKNVKVHLIKNGLFIFDVINPVLPDLCRKKEDVYVYDVFVLGVNSESGKCFRLTSKEALTYTGVKKELIVEDVVEYDSVNQIANFTLFYSSKFDSDFEINENAFDNNAGLNLTLTQRFYFPQEIELLLHFNGFEIISKYGDYQKNPFTSESGSQIIIAKKI